MISSLQVDSGPRVVNGIILEIVISLEYLNQAFLVNYFENCLAHCIGESKYHVLFLRACPP